MTSPANRAALALLFAAALAGAAPPPYPAPSEIAAAAPAADWRPIPASDLLVLDLAPTPAGQSRRVVIQLLPAPFSAGWTASIRKLAAAHWWDNLAVTRVQDDYVAQWGDPDADDKLRARPLPAGLAVVPESAYATPLPRVMLATPDGRRIDPPAPPEPIRWLPQAQSRDAYAPHVGHTASGWPIAGDGTALWPVHCYGMVGVGRGMSPDTGSGAELYAVIGHAPRHLDRNIALVGRVIEGIEWLSSLPRGTGPLGFYKSPAERTIIQRIRLGSDLPGLPAYQYLAPTSPSFARYADARANRRDPFFIAPAGGADICNVPVPVRRAP